MRIAALFLLCLPVLAPAQDVATLKKQAQETTQKIGELAASGRLPTDDQAMKLMEEMVAELKKIREALQRLEGPQARPLNGPGLRIGGYMQYQYVNTDVTNQYDGFTFRRIRPAFDYDVTKNVTARLSFEVAATSDRFAVQSRDVWIAWQADRDTRMRFGQTPLPLGYELVRSSQDREVPERSQYNQILFATERSRGVEGRVQRKGWEATAGLYNALTINDPEQVGRPPAVGSRLIGVVQGALTGNQGRVALAGAYGERPEFTSGQNIAPGIVRKFLYGDAEWHRGPLILRAEGFLGRDRIPGSFPGNAQNMSGGHLMGVYRYDHLDTLALRYEVFDPSRKNPGDSIFGWDVAWSRDLAFNTKLMISQELLNFGSRPDPSVGITTVRLQVRF